MADLPDGFVDPHDLASVTTILDSVLRSTGPAGLLDLLARIPGVRVEPGTPKGFLRAAVAACTWLGPENRLVQAEHAPTLVLEHVVGGITLSREALPPTTTGSVVARLLSETLTQYGGVEDASATLTAHRDLFGPA